MFGVLLELVMHFAVALLWMTLESKEPSSLRCEQLEHVDWLKVATKRAQDAMRRVRDPGMVMIHRGDGTRWPSRGSRGAGSQQEYELLLQRPSYYWSTTSKTLEFTRVRR